MTEAMSFFALTIGDSHHDWEEVMHGIIYIVGLIVVIMAVLDRKSTRLNSSHQ